MGRSHEGEQAWAACEEMDELLAKGSTVVGRGLQAGGLKIHGKFTPPGRRMMLPGLMVPLVGSYRLSRCHREVV